MHKDSGDRRCPVCGYPDLEEPAFDEFGSATFVICPSCGTEFGYHDATRSHEQLRQCWLANGACWHSRVVPAPAGWSPPDQLAAAGFLPAPLVGARDLR